LFGVAAQCWGTRQHGVAVGKRRDNNRVVGGKFTSAVVCVRARQRERAGVCVWWVEGSSSTVRSATSVPPSGCARYSRWWEAANRGRAVWSSHGREAWRCADNVAEMNAPSGPVESGSGGRKERKVALNQWCAAEGHAAVVGMDADESRLYVNGSAQMIYVPLPASRLEGRTTRKHRRTRRPAVQVAG